MTDDEKAELCDATTRAGDRCRRSPGHAGLHRMENGASWAPGTCGTPHPDKPGVTCALPMAHPGAHLDPDSRGRWTTMWREDAAEPESDAPSWPPKEWAVPQTIRGEIVPVSDLRPFTPCATDLGRCEKSDGHDGPHILHETPKAVTGQWSMRDATGKVVIEDVRFLNKPQAPVSGPCGVRLGLLTGSTSCTLRSGHEGLHGTGHGDYLSGRLVEEVLAEAFRRISDLEKARDRERERADRFRSQTQQTYERHARLFAHFQDHVTDELRKLAQRLDNAAFRLSALETRVQSVDLGSASAVQDIERRMETITNHLGKQAPGPLTEVTESLRLMTLALDEVRDRLPAKECGVVDEEDPDRDAYVCSLAPGHEGDHYDEPNDHTWPWRRRGTGLSLDLG